MAPKVDYKGNRQKEITILIGDQGPIKIESVEVKPEIALGGKEVLALVVVNRSYEPLKVVQIKALVYRPNGKLRGGAQWNERVSMPSSGLKSITIPLDIGIENGDHVVVSWGDNLLE